MIAAITTKPASELIPMPNDLLFSLLELTQ